MADYRAAWRATMQLLREGKSFSGHERNCIFLNTGAGPFANVSAITGLDFTDDGRAVAVTDWDQDGDLDIWLGNRTGPRLRLMRNETIRENVPDDGQFIAFRLQGTTSNRDAIGARVMLRTRMAATPATSQTPDENAIPQSIQTLYAGDAYLSQSSKWLHFGLGRETVVEQVTVRWPNGRTEDFSTGNFSAAKRYRLVEGTGHAEEVSLPRRSLALKPSAQPTFEPSLIGRTVLSNRFPMPILRYEEFDGTARSTSDERKRPLLVILWASWCPSCVAELSAVEAQGEELRRAGLDILALSLDGLDQGQRSEPQDAQRLVERLPFSFPVGMATREMLDKLEFTEGIVLNRQPSLAIPVSYLLDSEGALAAIYHGPVAVASLLDDVSKLDLPLNERRNLAVPLAGRWSRAPRQLLLRAVARLFAERGFADDYARYLALEADVVNQLRTSIANQQRESLDAHYASASFELGLALVSSGDTAEALEHFRRAVEVQPEHVEARINLGALLAKSGELEAAIQTLREAARLEPDSHTARMNLAAALESQNQFAEAIEQYRHILTHASITPQVHARLGRCLLEIGNMREAAEHLEQVLRVDANHRAAALSLAWLRATCPDESMRSGNQAVQLADELNTASGGKDPLVLDVLAAGYAEQGDFARALQVATQALAMSSRQPAALRSAVLAHLKSYQQQQPHRDLDGKYP